MEFPEELKDKIETTIGRKGAEFTYIIGELIRFNNTNLDCINPNKAIIKKNKKEIILLFYGEYYEEDDAFFIYNIHNKCSWNKLKEIMA